MTRCDVVLTTNQEVHINGTHIGNVLSVNVDHDASMGHNPRLTLEIAPTSVIFGQVPNETVDALSADQHPDSPTVDINRALARAAARGRGLDPNAHTMSASPPQPAPAPRKALPKKALSTYDDVEDASPEEACSHGMGGGDICYRPKGHTGSHRS